MHALEQIYKWRDTIARQEDESTGYILPNHMLLQLAQILPREIQGILACCQPTPPAVKQNLNELHLILLKSRELPLHVHKDKKRLSMPIIQKPSTIEVHENHDIGHEYEPHLGILEMDVNHVNHEVRDLPKYGSNLFRFFVQKANETPVRCHLSFTTPFDRFLKSQKNPVPAESETEANVRVKLEEEDADMKSESVIEAGKSDLMEIGDKIRSIRRSEAAKVPQPAAVAPHAYKASDMAIFQQGKKQSGGGKMRVRNRQRKGGSGRGRDEDEPGSVSFRYTVTK
jgi:hypothetical protein